MRFALSTREVLPADQPREHEMDIHPWTYRVMAQEMVREHKIESPSDPSTPAVGDQRTYLYIAVDHDTTPAARPAGWAWRWTSGSRADPTTYTSNHDVAVLDASTATARPRPRSSCRGDDRPRRRLDLGPPGAARHRQRGDVDRHRDRPGVLPRRSTTCPGRRSCTGTAARC